MVIKLRTHSKETYTIWRKENDLMVLFRLSNVLNFNLTQFEVVMGLSHNLIRRKYGTVFYPKYSNRQSWLEQTV